MLQRLTTPSAHVPHRPALTQGSSENTTSSPISASTSGPASVSRPTTTVPTCAEGRTSSAGALQRRSRDAPVAHRLVTSATPAPRPRSRRGPPSISPSSPNCSARPRCLMEAAPRHTAGSRSAEYAYVAPPPRAPRRRPSGRSRRRFACRHSPAGYGWAGLTATACPLFTDSHSRWHNTSASRASWPLRASVPCRRTPPRRPSGSPR